jgi:hypothetical protein
MGPARIVARAAAALYPDMVIRAAACLLAIAIFASPATAADVAVTIEQFGLMGIWADDCAEDMGKTRQAFRIVVAEPPGGGPTYTTINIDDGRKTTVHSLVLSAVSPSPQRLTLGMRIFGGDFDGGPLPSPTTNTFEQTFEKRADNAMQMAGNTPISLQRCRN